VHGVRAPVVGSYIALMPFFVAIAPERRGIVYSFRLWAAVREAVRGGREGWLLKRENLGFPAIDFMPRVEAGANPVGTFAETHTGHNRGNRGGMAGA
jgi:hypothetical protein